MSSSENELYGLVLCGGDSIRMGFDKSEIDYYGKKQKYFLYELLEEFCDNVFISCSRFQSQRTEPEYNVITDVDGFENSGPMAGILSFHVEHPGKSVIVTGCDYPFINRDSIEQLINNRGKGNGKAVCFINEVNDEYIYEPFLTVYEAPFFNTLLLNFLNKNYSLSRILEAEKVKAIVPPSDLILRNVNSTDEYLEAKKPIELMNYNFTYKHKDPDNEN